MGEVENGRAGIGRGGIGAKLTVGKGSVTKMSRRTFQELHEATKAHSRTWPSARLAVSNARTEEHLKYASNGSQVAPVGSGDAHRMEKNISMILALPLPRGWARPKSTCRISLGKSQTLCRIYTMTGKNRISIEKVAYSKIPLSTAASPNHTKLLVCTISYFESSSLAFPALCSYKLKTRRFVSFAPAQAQSRVLLNLYIQKCIRRDRVLAHKIHEVRPCCIKIPSVVRQAVLRHSQLQPRLERELELHLLL